MASTAGRELKPSRDRSVQTRARVVDRARAEGDEVGCGCGIRYDDHRRDRECGLDGIERDREHEFDRGIQA